MRHDVTPAGFAVIHDPEGTIAARSVRWAEGCGGSRVVDANPLTVIRFGAGRQGPAVWAESGLAVVVFGELDPLRSASPAERQEAGADPARLAAVAYKSAGEAAFHGLTGLFCGALWDVERQQLSLSRDGSGARALYWYQGDGWIAAATRLDYLVGMPDVPKGVSRVGLHEYLRFLDVSAPNTLYTYIQAVEPGVTVHFRRGRVRVSGPAQQPALAQPEAGLSFEDSVDALDAALQASVARRLAHGRETGVFLSGGVDSALLCAMAASIDPGAIDAFTVGFDEPAFDEGTVARDISSYLGIRHHCLRYAEADYAAAFAEFCGAVDLPFADPAGVPTLLLFKDCRGSVDTVLDGTGADTLVGVMPARHARLATQYAAALPPALRRVGSRLLRTLPGTAGYAPVLEFDRPEELLIRWKGWSRTEIQALCGGDVSLEQTKFYRVYRQFRGGDHLARYSALLGSLPDDRIHQAAEITGLRVRFPYWDEAVEEVIRHMPEGFRYSESQPKRVLRALLARYLPRRIWDRPKHGFDFPFQALLRREDHALVRRYLGPAQVARFGLVDAEMVGAYRTRFMQGDDGIAFRIWALVILHAWLEHHYEHV